MALKDPVDKLPLAVRKNVRDAYESKKPGYEAEMQKVLGESWTIELNPNLIYVYAPEDRQSQLGSVVTWYMDAFVSNLKSFVKEFGDDGVQELNSTCSKHQLVFAPQDSTTFSYGGLLVEDGALRLVFADGKLASNVNDVSRDFATALKNASTATPGSNAFNLVARQGVTKKYDPEIEKIRSAIATSVGLPDLKLNPNFEANSSVLAQSEKHKKDGWERNLGNFTKDYFKALKDQLDREKFKDDDMQQEGFQEAVTKGEVSLRILEKWPDTKSRYSELKIEEGVLYIQTTVDKWGVNISEAGKGLVDLL